MRGVPHDVAHVVLDYGRRKMIFQLSEDGRPVPDGYGFSRVLVSAGGISEGCYASSVVGVDFAKHVDGVVHHGLDGV